MEWGRDGASGGAATALFLGLLVVIGCINCLLLYNTLAERELKVSMDNCKIEHLLLSWS